MRILLISNNLSIDPYAVFPLGLGVIAKVLRQNNHEVKLIDMLGSNVTDASLQNTISNFDPQLVGIGIRNIDNVNSLNPCFFLDDIVLIKQIIRDEAQSPIFLGGAGFSLMPEAILAYIGAEYGIVGAGECAILALIQALESGAKIDSLLYATNFPPAFSGADYDDDIAKYYLRETGILPIQTKRGCPHRCVYCSYPLLEGKQCTHRSCDDIIDEMIFLRDKFHPESFYFTDSIFNDPGGAYLELLEAMVKHEISAPWSAFFTPDDFDKESIALMRRSGIKTVELGADGMTDATLLGLGKNYDFAIVEKSCAAFLNQGIQVSCSYIAGGPNETMATLLDGIDNIKQLKQVPAFVFMGIRILPNTPIETIAKREGIISNDHNLLFPTFYYSPSVQRDQIYNTLENGFKNAKHVIFPPHAKSKELRLYRKLQTTLAGETAK
ncbi:MAG: lipid biosynthesis B12-binding/radical SAM protein [Lentisphaerota bacterium]